MEYTLAGAAQATGKGRTTIFRAIKAGRVSARRLDDGSYRIDAAELARAFPPGSVEQPESSPWKSKEQQGTPSEEGGTELAVLRERWERAEERTRGLEDQLARERELSDRAQDTMRETVDDLRKRLDRAEERVLALTAQPVPQPAQEPPAAVEELRRRLEESEARIRALVTAAPPALQGAREQLSEAPAGLTPAGPLRSFLGRLLGR